MAPSLRTDRILALATVALTGLWALMAVSLPVPSRKLSLAAALTIGALALGHASLYWNADQVRSRVKFGGYVTMQLSLLFGIAVAGAIFPFGLALLIAFTARAVTDRGIVAAAAVTAASFSTFLLAAIATADLYRGATAGFLLAATGIVAYSIRLLIARRAPDVHVVAPSVASSSTEPISSNGRSTELTARELEVLRAVARGSRTSDVAQTMGISERTVKAHLTAIYQKLGVENRAGAISAAMRAELL